MEQKDSIGGARAPDARKCSDGARAPETRETRMLCALCGEQPVAGGPDAPLGEPLCKGPVCRWCYETKVLPARRQNGESWGAHGAWAFRTPEGKLVMGALPGGRDAQDALRAAVDELIMGMMDEGYFGMVQDMDAVEACMKAAAMASSPGKPLGISAFGRLYVIPWYGPALLTGPRHVVQTLERKVVA